MTQKTTDILILGAGIGGYETFRTLERLLSWYGIKKTITIVDENNYFTFTPLLHEVASGSVEPSHCTFSLREMVYKTPHNFIQVTVKSVEAEKNTVTTSEGAITYEFCVMALGSGVHFFNTPGAETYAHTVRTLTKAMNLREQIIKHLEQTPAHMAITVVGAGYTGVEVAGQMAFLHEHTLKKIYPKTKITIRIVESSQTAVPQLPARAQRKIIKRLTKLNVELLFGKRVEEVAQESIKLDSGEELPSDHTIWCTGIRNVADSFIDKDHCEKSRLPVTSSLNHKNYSNFYGIGDIALGYNKGSDQPFPQLGEVAHKQGEYVARHIVATLRNRKIPPFHFKSRGMLMPIGERYAIAVIGPFVISGLFAWWLRRTVYVLFMPGLVRKLKLIMDWTLHLFGFSYIIDIERKQ